MSAAYFKDTHLDVVPEGSVVLFEELGGGRWGQRAPDLKHHERAARGLCGVDVAPLRFIPLLSQLDIMYGYPGTASMLLYLVGGIFVNVFLG